MENKTESMVSGYGYSDTSCWMSLSHQIGETRREVAETGCGLSKQIGEGNCSLEKSIGDAECDILSKVGDAECNINKNITDTADRNTIHLNSIQTFVTKEIGDKTEIVRTQLGTITEKIHRAEIESRNNTDRILKQMSDYEDKRDADQKEKERFDRLYEKIDSRFGGVFQTLSHFEQKLNSVEQEQKFVNKQISYGGSNTNKTNSNQA